MKKKGRGKYNKIKKQKGNVEIYLEFAIMHVKTTPVDIAKHKYKVYDTGIYKLVQSRAQVVVRATIFDQTISELCTV